MKKLILAFLSGLISAGSAFAQETQYSCGHDHEEIMSEKDLSTCGDLANYKLDKTNSYQYSPVYRPNVQIHVFQYSATDPRNFTVADMSDLNQIMTWINDIYGNIQVPTRPVIPATEEETDSRIEFNWLPVEFIVDPVAWDRGPTNQSSPLSITGFPSLTQLNIPGTLPFTPTCIEVSGNGANDGVYSVVSTSYDGVCGCTHVNISGSFASTAGTGSAVLLQALPNLNCSWDTYNNYHTTSLNTMHVYFTSQSNRCAVGFGCAPSPYWCNLTSPYPMNPAGYFALAQLTAHELGHCLGLPHTANSNVGCPANTINPSIGITDLPTSDCMGWLTCNATNTSNNVMGYNTCRNYFSPLQIAYMRRNLSTDVYRINYLKECSYDAAETVTINGNVTWNNKEVVGGDIIIPTGSTLTIQCRVNMPEGSVIKVHPGGKLVVDGGTLTNLCGDWWQGIEAIGNPAVHTQSAANQATVILKNGALIENAYVAIRGGEVDPSLVTKLNQGGAIVQVTNTTFRNNWWGVQFSPYDRQNSLGASINNASYVKQSWFINDAPLTNPAHTEPTSCISIWDARGIQILGNTFESARTDLAGKENLQGVGVTLADAMNTTISTYCTSMIFPCPAGNIIPNKFINLYIGVESFLGAGTDNITIRGNEFENCVYGVKSSGSSFPNIILNKFEIPFATGALWPGSILYSDAFGVYLDGNYSYNVEENTFIPFQNGGSGQSVGVMANNSSAFTSGSKIYRNDFGDVTQSISTRGLTLGVQTQGNSSTLQVDCNRFYEGDLTSKIDIHWATGSLANQGACSATDPLLPQANEFYGSTCSMSALNAQIWRNAGTTGNPNYHSYSSGGYDDACNNWGTYSKNCAIAGEPAYAYNTACPSSFGIIKSTQVAEGTSLAQQQAEIAEVNDLIAGANTEHLDYYIARKYDLLGQLISHYLDSNDLSGALNILTQDGSLEALCVMVPLQVENKMYAEAKANLAFIYKTAMQQDAVNPDQQQTIDLLNFCEFYRILETTIAQPAGYFALSPTQLEELQVIADGHSPVAANARAILSFVHFQRTYSPAYPIDGAKGIAETPAVQKGSLMRCFPNPNQGNFTVEISVGQDQAEGVIEVYDPLGKLVLTTTLQPSDGNRSVQIEGLSTGVYQVIYSVNDEIIATEKLVVTQ